MIPVVQTKVVVRNSKDEMIVRGNCMAACVAALLEMPITDVPNVETLFHISDSYWFEVLTVWLKSLGYDYSTDMRFKIYHDDSYGIEEGKRIQWAEETRDKLYLVVGKSPRGVMHSCIYKNGLLIHDPHPTKEGLLTEDYFESILPYENYN